MVIYNNTGKVSTLSPRKKGHVLVTAQNFYIASMIINKLFTIAIFTWSTSQVLLVPGLLFPNDKYFVNTHIWYVTSCNNNLWPTNLLNFTVTLGTVHRIYSHPHSFLNTFEILKFPTYARTLALLKNLSFSTNTYTIWYNIYYVYIILLSCCILLPHHVLQYIHFTYRFLYII